MSPMVHPSVGVGSPESGPVKAKRALILVGNANVGKSVIFGALTGRYVTVSNYPGTTVEVSRGNTVLDDLRWEVLDTPGTNGLVPLSEDEAVTRDLLLEGNDVRVVQVCDAKNLRRGLLLFSQLAEAGVPLMLCLNMADEASQRGLTLDESALAETLGTPVVQTVAVRGEGLDELRHQVGRARATSVKVAYPAFIEDAVERIQALLPDQKALGTRALALMSLASDEHEDPSLWARLRSRLTPDAFERLACLRAELTRHAPEPWRQAISRARLAWADSVVAGVVRRTATPGLSSLAQRAGALAVHPVWGWPLLLVVLVAAYGFVGVFGAGTLVGLLEKGLFERHLVPWTEWLVRHLVSPGRVQELLVGPAQTSASSSGLIVGRYGLVSMALSYGIALVLPIVSTFFLFFSVLEDSGYLPRLAVMLHRVFKAMGLHGKAVLPMVLGLGCDTMATISTRVLETRKDRILVTLLLALGVPCSAQLGVILGMLSAVSLRGALFWAVTVVGTIFLVGYLAAKVVPGKSSDFLLELPPIRLPQMRNIVVKTLARIEWYLKEALPLFVIGTLVLWLMDRAGLIAVLERVCAPVVEGFLGLPRAATAAFIIGFLRRDYGAAGLFDLFHPAMQHGGALPRETEIQLVVSMVTLTLFLPCFANFLVIVKERGMRTGLAIVALVLPLAVAVGGLVNFVMRHV